MRKERSINAGNFGMISNDASWTEVRMDDAVYLPDVWRSFDRCDGITTTGAHFSIVHEVADAARQGSVIRYEWYHRLTVTCDDPTCCPEPIVFTGDNAWQNACVQLQDLVSFLAWQ